MRTFKEGETYVVYDNEKEWAILRPFSTTNDESNWGLLVHGWTLHNMNNHWHKHDFDRADGENTWPFLLTDAINVSQREIRPASEIEAALLDFAININAAPTNKEIDDLNRQFRRDEILEELGI